MKLYIGFGLLELTTYAALVQACVAPSITTVAFAAALGASTLLLWRSLGGRFSNARYLVSRFRLTKKGDSCEEA